MTIYDIVKQHELFKDLNFDETVDKLSKAFVCPLTLDEVLGFKHTDDDGIPIDNGIMQAARKHCSDWAGKHNYACGQVCLFSFLRSNYEPYEGDENTLTFLKED